MGKVTIVSEQGAGEYTATLDYDLYRATARIAALDAQITDLTQLITSQISTVATAQADLDVIQAELNTAIQNSEPISVLVDILKRMQAPAADLIREKLQLKKLKLDKVAAQKQRTWLADNIPDTLAITVWCADYTEGLSGEVGTAEVMGEPTAPPIIQPGTALGTASDYDQTRDYIMQPAVASGGAAVYYNRAFLPAWQKWMPTYRVGELTAKNGDVCDVALDAALSVEQGLDVNQTAALSSVPIEYMNANGAVFEPGDRVLVKFENQNWSEPKVVGFESNPKPELLIHIMESGQYGTTVSGTTRRMNRYNPDGSFAKEMFNYGALNGYIGGLKVKPDTGEFCYYAYDGNFFVGTNFVQGHTGKPSYILKNTGPFGVNSNNLFVSSSTDGSTSDDSELLRRLSLSGNHQAVLTTGYENPDEPCLIHFIHATDNFLVLVVFQGTGVDEKNQLAIHNLNGSLDTALYDFGTLVFTGTASGIVGCVSTDEKRFYAINYNIGTIVVADLENKVMLPDIPIGLGAQPDIYSIAATPRNLVCIEGGIATSPDLQHNTFKPHIWDIDDQGNYTKRPDVNVNWRNDFYSSENNCYLIG